MSQVPEVLIMGRPNVGKSTFLNRLIKSQHAITEDLPGVTRDLISRPYQWKGKSFFLVDSGGVHFSKSGDVEFQTHIENQVKSALERCARILFVVDVNDGVAPSDQSIAAFLRPYRDKIIVVVNKVDNDSRSHSVSDFYSLGFGEPFAISSLHGTGISTVMDMVADELEKAKPMSKWLEQAYRIAIVGRPNVGKSSLINALVQDNRVIVSDEAGTTRDAVDVYFVEHGTRYVFTDTAGLRKKARVKDSIEYYSTVRTTRSIDQADLVVVVVEPDLFLCEQDKRILTQVIESRKNLIVFVNKCDTLEDDSARKLLLEKANHTLPFLENYPILFGSVLNRQGFKHLFHHIPSVIQSGEIRVSTGQLNQFVERVLKRLPPPVKRGKQVKVLYATQVSSAPPVFIVFVNHPELVGEDYKRFVEKRLRPIGDGFVGNPVQIFFKKTGSPGTVQN